MDRKYKMMIQFWMILDLNDIQHAAKKLLMNFQNTNGIQDVAKSKPSGCLVADTVIQKRKLNLKEWNYKYVLTFEMLF